MNHVVIYSNSVQLRGCFCEELVHQCKSVSPQGLCLGVMFERLGRLGLILFSCNELQVANHDLQAANHCNSDLVSCGNLQQLTATQLQLTGCQKSGYAQIIWQSATHDLQPELQ